MRVIVFDRELHEPLTVVEIPHKLAEEAKQGYRIRLMPHPKIEYMPPTREAPEFSTFKIVTLTFQRVCQGASETLFWYAYADDPETALLLRAAYLPGQIGDVQRREKRAYFEGMLTGAAR